ncbi:hypothetical protein H6G81_18590 [Scytonema hofmannii FACHB-248]|uniref:Uncharacterized protein n=1 Tax=Scytonema hofmannii FACHB-248 TaxID=1842502 RepID=A0ABR8GT09_9CYAN|nr:MULTISPECIES: hypothetical protein [Nostocales]MBD2606483.1 hypothetical protein [Scytonema hofmannii FACHB-248]
MILISSYNVANVARSLSNITKPITPSHLLYQFPKTRQQKRDHTNFP